MTDEFRRILINELKLQHASNPAQKDIIIVIHNQYDLVKKCLDSVTKHTKNYNLYLWDNASDEKTASLIKQYKSVLVRNETNIGFIEPNNRLAEMTTSPYIILLNSDTVVSPGWDDAMIGFIQNGYGVVGYQGRLLDNNGQGKEIVYGENIDYVEGWCMCLSREIYNKFGLFDSQLEFAYFEDSDLCLRIKEKGYKLYALSLKYVQHVGGATSKMINQINSFNKNSKYFKNKWNFINDNGRKF